MNAPTQTFPTINPGYAHVFQKGKLTVGLVVPIEAYAHTRAPVMADHLALVQRAEALGFRAVWLRDVPLDVPSFGDAGQGYDPMVYLGYLAGATSKITLGVASVVLPLRHPLHLFKQATSVDQLSGGRLVLGVGSGDRPQEYPVVGVPFAERGERFRQGYEQLRAWAAKPSVGGANLLPTPFGQGLAMLVTGSSQQSPDWIAKHSEGWMVYPSAPDAHAATIAAYDQRLAAVGRGPRPVMQPLYIDLQPDPYAPPTPMHLGLRLGVHTLTELLKDWERAGLAHVALNLRQVRGDVRQTLDALAEHTLIHFASGDVS